MLSSQPNNPVCCQGLRSLSCLIHPSWKLGEDATWENSLEVYEKSKKVFQMLPFQFAAIFKWEFELD